MSFRYRSGSGSGRRWTSSGREEDRSRSPRRNGRTESRCRTADRQRQHRSGPKFWSGKARKNEQGSSRRSEQRHSSCADLDWRVSENTKVIFILLILYFAVRWRLKLTGKIGIGKRKENPAPGNLPGQGKFLDEIRVLSREISSSNLKQRMSIGKFSWWEMASTE